MQGKHRDVEPHTTMQNTSRNSITNQPHKKKSNHRHQAAHASVIHLRIISIAIFKHFKIGGDGGDGGDDGGGQGGGCGSSVVGGNGGWGGGWGNCGGGG